MVATPKLEVTLYDRSFGFLQDVAGFVSAEITRKANAADAGSLVLEADDPANVDLMNSDCRYVATYGGRFHSSGRVILPEFDLLPNKPITYTLVGDWSIFEDTLAMVRPKSTIRPASLADLGQAYQRYPGDGKTVAGQWGCYLWDEDVFTTETAIKRLVAENVRDRLRRPVTMRADLGRGGNARLEGRLPEDLRNGYVAEGIASLLAWSGLVLRAWQEPDGRTILVDVVEPSEYGQELDAETGTLKGGTGKLGYPDATRALVMGPGEDAGRAFEYVIDEAAEEEFGYVIETVVDATSPDVEWPEGVPDDERIWSQLHNRGDVPQATKDALRAYMIRVGSDKLAELAAKAALTTELAENESFYYGIDDNGYEPGDWLGITSHGVPLRDQITACTVKADKNGETTATPTLGSEPAAGEDPETAVIFDNLIRLAQSSRRRSTGR
ncbi:hypothetical protein [Clavibacter sp. VKM Ac-2872]|uniref:Gp37-like protein n=1 Tax=Clavibacter sp. VKM Ac-2872 TaxID=2783812 RepID=UPI001889FF6A|nr:hypothetical protein [Clavibacter sp. VKM Ac-2872]MBF4625552.1 hypothetical protein [Clavibacter sp. VKM Ac-2872]